MTTPVIVPVQGRTVAVAAPKPPVVIVVGDAEDQAVVIAPVPPRGPEGPPGVTGTPGAKGDKGDQGDVGPMGPSGTAVGSATYTWSSNTTASDPGSGRIKANSAIDTAMTEIYASVYDTSGRIVRFDQVEAGNLIWIYESGQLDTWNSYKVMNPIILSIDRTWYRISVIFFESGPTEFTPGNNKAIEVQTPVQPGQGPQGIQGPPGTPALWTQMTQAAYNALPVKDPNTLYVIVG